MKQFQFYITDDLGQSYYVQNGVVLTSGTPKALVNSPDGWEDIMIAWERNLNKHGIIRNFSLPLGFVNDGAKILRQIYYTTNIEKKIFLVVKKLNASTTLTNYQFKYDHYYKGELDLSTFTDDFPKVTVSIMEGGLSKLLAAAENTKIEIPLDSTAIIVKLDGLEIEQRANYTVIDGVEIRRTTGGSKTFFAPLFAGNREGNGQNVAFVSQELEYTDGVSWADRLLSSNYFGKVIDNAHYNPSVRIRGTLNIHCTTNVVNVLKLRFIHSNQNIVDIDLYEIVNFTPVTDGNYSFPVDITIPLQPGERLYLEGSFVQVSFGGDLGFEFTTGSNLYCTYVDVYKATYIKAQFPTVVYEKLITNAAKESGKSKSDLLESYKHLVLTSGDAIRGTENAKIKTSINEFYSSYDAILMAGMSIEDGKILLEDRARYYDSSNPVSLGKIKNLKVKKATELCANTIKNGYEKAEIDDVNGKYESNNSHLYSSPVARIVRELSMISPYRSAPYEIEIKRINLDGKTTTDSDQDNQVYILNIDINNPISVPGVGDTVYVLKRETYTSVTGIPFPDSIFNIEDLTPLRMLVKSRAWINSIFHGFEGQSLKFETTEQNRDLWTIGGPGGSFKEDADFTIQDNPRLFKPEAFEFDTEVPVNLTEILETSVNRCFDFEWDGVTYKGFLLKSGIASSNRKEQAFRLLSTPDNDLTKLI